MIGDVVVDGTGSGDDVVGIMLMLGYASYCGVSTGRAPPRATGSGTKPEPDRIVGSIGDGLSGGVFTQFGVAAFA